MLKQTITYKDFLDEEQTEDFYFNLTEAEIAKLELTAEGNSLRAWTEKIVKAENAKAIIDTFEKILDTSYGVKSEDGRKFRKSPEILDDFKSSNAYSKLWMTLVTNTDEATRFINGIIPSDLAQAKEVGSTQARQKSEEQMQGFRRPQQKPQPMPQVIEPNLPVENVEIPAPPLPAQQAPNADQLPPVNPEAPTQDINSMSAEQLRELVTRQQGGFPGTIQ